MMTTRIRILLFVVVATAVVLFLAVVLRAALIPAQFPVGVIVTNEYVLSEAQQGDLVVAASSIVINEGVRITGSASFVGERVEFYGDATGDLTILAPTVTLGTGQIGGRLHILADEVTIGAQVEGDALIDADTLTLESSVVFAINPAICAETFIDEREIGETADCPPATLDPFGDLIALRQAVEAGTTSSSLPVLLPDALRVILVAVILAGLAPLTVSLVPNRVTRVVRAMRNRPIRSALTGTAVFCLIVGLTAAQITLLGTISPIGLVALPIYAAVLVGGVVLSGSGLIALSLLIGTRLTGDTSNTAQPPVVAAAVGGMIMAGALALIGLQPFGEAVSILLLAALAVVGTGAAFGTRLGRIPASG